MRNIIASASVSASARVVAQFICTADLYSLTKRQQQQQQQSQQSQQRQDLVGGHEQEGGLPRVRCIVCVPEV